MGLAAALAAVTPAHADPVDRWHALIAEASSRFGVPATWIERVMRAESGGLTASRGQPITSRAGAMGLMQLMPATWTAMRRTLGLGADPYDPHDNIMAGTAYLALMYEQFGYPGLFGAYNAGPSRYAAYLTTGRPLPAKTRGYLVSVTGTGRPAALPAAKAPDRLFFAIGAMAMSRHADRRAVSDLFVPLRRDDANLAR